MSAASAWIERSRAAPTNGPAAIPRNVRAPIAPSARGRSWPLVEVGRRGRRDRDQGAAPDGLDEPRGDELVEALGRAGEERPDREGHERTEEQPPRAPQVGEAAGERHRGHVHQQVAVDDPGRPPQLRPVGQVDDDRRQRDRRDHQLEAGQEDAGAQDGQQDERRGTGHGRSVAGSACGAGRDAVWGPSVVRAVGLRCARTREGRGRHGRRYAPSEPAGEKVAVPVARTGIALLRQPEIGVDMPARWNVTSTTIYESASSPRARARRTLPLSPSPARIRWTIASVVDQPEELRELRLFD